MVDSHQDFYESIIKAGYLQRDAVYVFEESGKRPKKFRARDLFDKTTNFEKKVLRRAKKGKRILDVGAGAGRISLYLQKKGLDVTALEKSRVISGILRKRGLKQVVCSDFFTYHPAQKYDMVFLARVFSVLGGNEKDAGRFFKILAGRYLGKGGELVMIFGGYEIGEKMVKRRFIFRNRTGPWFEGFCPAPETLIRLAGKHGLTAKKSRRGGKSGFYIVFEFKN